MLDVLYEDKDVLVVVKPAGIESQTSRRLEPDMVSEIKNYLHRKAQEAKKLSTGLSPKASTVTVEPYVGVIHRLDKPVRGVMVYAKNQKAAAHLSRQVQDGKLEKIYQAVVCGKPVDNVGKYVDYLLKDGKTNTSRIVDKSAARCEAGGIGISDIRRKRTGRWSSALSGGNPSPHRASSSDPRAVCCAWNAAGGRYQVWCTSGCLRGTCPPRAAALCAVRLSFLHPVTGERMEFSTEPQFTL